MLHHVPALSRLLGTAMPEWNDRWLLLGAGFVPLIVLETVKALRRPLAESANH